MRGQKKEVVQSNENEENKEEEKRTKKQRKLKVKMLKIDETFLLRPDGLPNILMTA